MKPAVLPLLFSAVLLAGEAHAQDPFHRRFASANGLPSDQVYCAMQDRDGFMWFGTDAGASRYDGVDFVNLGPAEGLSDSEVIGIHEDSAGRIWFLTLNGALSFWKSGVVHNASTDPCLGRYRGKSGWSSFCEDKDGRLWFGGIRGDVMRLDMRSDDVLYIQADHKLRSLIRDRSGAVLGVTSLGIERFDGQLYTVIRSLPEGSLTNHIVQPVRAGQPAISLGASGVYELSESGASVLEGTEGTVDPRLHRNAMRDGAGNIWMFRKDEGVDLLVHTREGWSAPERQFASYRINSVFVSDEGDRWYCTANQGVFLVDRQVLGHTALYEADKNSGTAFISIAQGKDRVWVGTDQGHILQYRDGRMTEAFRPDEGRLPGRILRIVPDRSGDIWFATDWGLFHWYRERAELSLLAAVDTVNGQVARDPQPAKSVLVAADGTVWSPGIGLWKNVRVGTEWVRQRITRVERYRIYCIAQDSSGTIWTADADRLQSWRDGVTSSCSLPGEFAGARITDITSCGGDTLAISTAGKGVLLSIGARRVGSISISEGLASPMVRRSRWTGDTLWCATAKGLSVFRCKRGRVQESWTWSTREGLPTDDVRDMLVTPDRSFLATDLGLCISPHRPAVIERTPPRLVLTGLMIGDSVVLAPVGMLKVRTSDRLRMDVHALEFANAALVEYGVSIDGSPWSPCVLGHVEAGGLEEGGHMVRVRARLPGGDWTAPMVVNIDATPPWWASRVATAAGMFALLALALLGLYAWSRRDLRKRIEEVRATAVVNEERRRIAADVHDDLGADLSRVLMHARRLESQAGAPEASSVSSGIMATIDRIDEVIWSLDPKRDTLRSTVHFIEQQARELAEANALRYRTVVELPEGDIPLAAKDRREVMLIAREALRNVVEHARATTLRVEWRLEGNALSMAVADDGTGMVPPNGEERHGIQNMKDRAQRLGGTLSISSVEPHGTRVELWVYLKWNHPIG